MVPEAVSAGPSRQCPVFPSYLGEGFHTAVDVLVAVHGRDLDPDAGLSLGNHRVAEANDINACRGKARRQSWLGGREAEVAVGDRKAFGSSLHSQQPSPGFRVFKLPSMEMRVRASGGDGVHNGRTRGLM